MDQLTNFRVHILQRRLENCKFDVAGWYAKKRAKALSLKKTRRFWSVLGYPLEEVPATILQQGISAYYPNVNPSSSTTGQFSVSRTKYIDDYLIHDLDLDLETWISVQQLNDPELNIIQWYMDRLDKDQTYNTHYLAQRLSCEPENIELNSLEWDVSPSTLAAELEYLQDYSDGRRPGVMGDVYGLRLDQVLQSCQPYPGDIETWINPQPEDGRRFDISWPSEGIYTIFDRKQGFEVYLHVSRLRFASFSIGKWFAAECARRDGDTFPGEIAEHWSEMFPEEDLISGTCLEDRARVHQEKHFCL